jgi:hypothetical protein
VCEYSGVRRGFRTAGVLVGLLGLGLGGCAPAFPDLPGGPPPDDPIAASRSSPDAPASFKERTKLESCGEFVVELAAESFPDDALACLDAAFDSGAELVVQVFTIEGDPVVFYYRVGPDIEGIEIFVDSTLDPYGAGWSHQSCPSATSFLDQTDCAEVD